jgi:hypothetical protein
MNFRNIIHFLLLFSYKQSRLVEVGEFIFKLPYLAILMYMRSRNVFEGDEISLVRTYQSNRADSIVCIATTKYFFALTFQYKNPRQ